MEGREQSIGGYTFANFRLDLAAQRLSCGDNVVPIGGKAFDTLVALVRNHDRVVAKDELIKWVWPNTFVSEDSLTHTISALRRALGDDPAKPAFIVTVARRGYRFVSPVAYVPASAPEGSAVDLPQSHPTQTATRVAAAPFGALSSAAAPTAWAALGIALGVALVLAVQRIWLAPPSASVLPPIRFTVEPPSGTTLVSGGALSPDGRSLAFVARDETSGHTQIWVRSLDSTEPRPLKGTEGGMRPFWSPDTQFIGFFAGSRVMRVGLTGDAPQSIAPTIGVQPSGGSWSSDGRIVYVDSGSLYVVSAAGGTPAELKAASRRVWEVPGRPQFLPGGRRFLYSLISVNPEQAGTYAGSLDSPDRVRILDATNSSVFYSPDGYLLYIHDGVLLAHRFDVSRLRLIGDPQAMAGNLSATADVSAAAGGVLAFGGGATVDGPVWFDRMGKALGPLSGTGPLENLAFSPDHRQMVGNTPPPHEGIWLIDLDRGGVTRMVADGVGPVWAPDGSRIAFSAWRAGKPRSIVSRVTTGAADELMLAEETTPAVVVNDWSRDGRFIAYVTLNARTKNDVWLLPTFGDRKPVPLLVTPANETQARISPDGRWIAYTSDESGTPEVYVEAFPAGGAKQTVSVGGGAQPQWRADGKELYYLSLDNMLTAVEVASGRTLRAGRPQPLFRAPVLEGLTGYRNVYVPTEDGQRFLIKAALRRQPISAIVRWTAPTQ